MKEPTPFMLRIVVALALAALTAFTARPALAQATPLSSLRAGDTIRVWAVEPRLNGRLGFLEAVVRDSVRLADHPQPPAAVTAVAYPALRRIDVQRGVHRSPLRIVIGTLAGGAVGAFVGSFLGYTIECSGECRGDLDGLGGFLIGGTAGMFAGGITGGVVAARYKVPRWEGVDLRRR